MKTDKIYKGVVGSGNPLGKMVKDSDGDKVINVLDCKPNDPKKQGFIHRAGSFVARKVGATETAERIKESGEFEDETKRQERVVFREERRKARIELAKKRGSVISSPLSNIKKAAKHIPKVRQQTKKGDPLNKLLGL